MDLDSFTQSIVRRTDAFSASLATAFVAAASLVVSVGGEARPYGLAFGFCAASMYFLLRCFEATTPARTAAYTASMAIALYLHPLTVLLFAAQWMTIAAGSRERAELRILLPALPLACCTLLPVVALVHASGAGQLDWVSRLSRVVVQGFARGLFGAYYGLPLIAIAAAFAVALTSNCNTKNITVYVGIWFIGPIALLFGVSAFKPMLISYYILYVWLPAGMIAGLALHAVKQQPRLRALAATCTLALVVWNLLLVPDALQHRENWRGLVAYYLAHRAHGDAFVVYAPYTVLPFRYAFAERGEPVPKIVFPSDSPVVADAISRRALSAAEIHRLSSQHTVWLVLSHAAIGRPDARRNLRALFERCRLTSSHTVPSRLPLPMQIDRFDCGLRG